MIADRKFPEPVLTANKRRSTIIIWAISLAAFGAFAFLSGFKLDINLGFDPHLFAAFNAGINAIVVVLLICGLIAVKSGNYNLHKRIMIAAIILSVLFLISYICHHLLTGETKFGDINHDGIVSADEKFAAGNLRYVYYFILLTHIPLAGIILPFILFTAYRALSGNYARHKKLARITWPIWLYVAVTGIAVYFLIRPYYS